MIRKLLVEQRGYSLMEVMASIIILSLAILPMVGMFDMGLQTATRGSNYDKARTLANLKMEEAKSLPFDTLRDNFPEVAPTTTTYNGSAFGSNKVEAMESARLGVEKMEREIRGAYRYNSGASPSQNHLFFTTASPTDPLAVPPTTVTQITFGNDMGAPGAGNGVIECGAPCEYITYKLTDDASVAACTAANAPCTLRRVNTANSGDLGDPVVENVAANGLTFTFLQGDGATLATSESEIGIVLVSLDIAVNQGTNTEGTQTLTTAIDLRNRQ